MRPGRIAVILGMLFLTANFARADKVTTDFDHSVNFYKFKTFMWVHEPETKEAFVKDRIIQAVTEQLTARGLRQVSDGADLAVGANLATEEKHTWETYYTGGGWGWDGGGWSTTTVKTYEVGALTVDLFDSNTKKLVWQGVSTDTVPNSPEKRTKNDDKQIEKMFKNYPPFGRESSLGLDRVAMNLSPLGKQ